MDSYNYIATDGQVIHYERIIAETLEEANKAINEAYTGFSIEYIEESMVEDLTPYIRPKKRIRRKV